TVRLTTCVVGAASAARTRGVSSAGHATSVTDPTTRGDAPSGPTVSTAYTPPWGRSWSRTAAERCVTPRIPQRTSPVARAASSVTTAWCARWNAPIPRWTIPTCVGRTGAGHDAGCVSRCRRGRACGGAPVGRGTAVGLVTRPPGSDGSRRGARSGSQVGRTDERAGRRRAPDRAQEPDRLDRVRGVHGHRLRPGDRREHPFPLGTVARVPDRERVGRAAAGGPGAGRRNARDVPAADLVLRELDRAERAVQGDGRGEARRRRGRRRDDPERPRREAQRRDRHVLGDVVGRTG